jgi:hypothetical protein
LFLPLSEYRSRLPFKESLAFADTAFGEAAPTFSSLLSTGSAPLLESAVGYGPLLKSNDSLSFGSVFVALLSRRTQLY